MKILNKMKKKKGSFANEIRVDRGNMNNSPEILAQGPGIWIAFYADPNGGYFI